MRGAEESERAQSYRYYGSCIAVEFRIVSGRKAKNVITRFIPLHLSLKLVDKANIFRSGHCSLFFDGFRFGKYSSRANWKTMNC